MTSFVVQYRNFLGSNRRVEFDVDDHNEARQELIRNCGHDIDEEAAPLRIERINLDGIHTDTWTCDNAFDSCLIHQMSSWNSDRL